MKYIEVDGIGPVLFEHSKRAKRTSITVTSHKGVRVAVPSRASFDNAEKFVETKIDWIKKHQTNLRQAERKYESESVHINRLVARRELIQRLDELAARNGFTYNRVFIRNQRTRWGSCSAKNNINLNIKLVLLPDELKDYVILHELVHTNVKNHSQNFWDELGKYMNNPKQKASQLRKNGLGLL